MSLSLLNETRSELRRLSIAGGALAKDDVRLKKLVPQCAAAGNTAPVFVRLGGLLEKAAGEGGAADLLEAGVLVNAVLTTQAGNGCTGDLVPLERESSVTSAPVSYRAIRPLLTALTTKGGGRFAVIEQGVDSRAICDIRLAPALIGALNDSYADIPPLVTKVIKEIGRPFLPLLMRDYTLKDKKAGNACRLEIIAHFLGEDGADLYREAFEKGAPLLKLKAVEAMSGIPAFEPLLIETARSGGETIRFAAFGALGRMSGEAVETVLKEALRDKYFRHAIDAVSRGGVPSLIGMMGAEAKALRAGAVADLTAFHGREVPNDSAMARYLYMLNGIANASGRSPAAFELARDALSLTLGDPDIRLPTRSISFSMLPTFGDEEWERNSYYDGATQENEWCCQTIAAKCLASLNTVEALHELESHLQAPAVNRGTVYITAKLALKLRDTSSFHDLYRPFLQKGQPDQLRGAMTELFSRLTDFLSRRNRNSDRFDAGGLKLDPRWVSWFIERGDLPLVAAFAAPGQPDTDRFLIEKLERTAIPSNHHMTSLFIVAQAMTGLWRTGAAGPFLPLFFDWVENHYLLHYLQEVEGKSGVWEIPRSHETALVLALFPEQGLSMLERIHVLLEQRKSRHIGLVEALTADFRHMVAKGIGVDRKE